jgi:hypothetical protein
MPEHEFATEARTLLLIPKNYIVVFFCPVVLWQRS